MITDDRQTIRDQPLQQAQARSDTQIAIGVVDTPGFRKAVGQWIVERDITREAPAAVEQKRHMPRSVAGSGESVDAGKKFVLVTNDLDTIP